MCAYSSGTFSQYHCVLVAIKVPASHSKHIGRSTTIKHTDGLANLARESCHSKNAYEHNYTVEL